MGMKLIGKSKSDIKYDFCKMYNVPSSKLDELIKHLKYNIYMGEKTKCLIIGIPSILVGLTFIVSFIAAMTMHKYPMIYPFKEASFYQMFVDIIAIVAQLGFALFMIIGPLVWMSRVFDWGD
jgi:hypothetical protein